MPCRFRHSTWLFVFRLNGVSSQSVYTKHPNLRPCHLCDRTHQEIRNQDPSQYCTKDEISGEDTNIDWAMYQVLLRNILVHNRLCDFPLHGTKNVTNRMIEAWVSWWKSLEHLCGATAEQFLARLVYCGNAQKNDAKGVTLM